MKIFQFKSKNWTHKQAVTGLGQELSYILLTAGGDNSTASLNTLSTSNSSDTCDIPGSLLQQRGPLGRQASICKGWQLALSLFCLLSIKGFVLYCKIQISISFANKVAKIWPKSNSLVTYNFWAKIQGCTFATPKVNRFASIVVLNLRK